MINLQDFRWHKYMFVLLAMLLCMGIIATMVIHRIDSLDNRVSNIEGHVMTLKEDAASIDTHLEVMEKTVDRIEANIDILVESNKND